MFQLQIDLQVYQPLLDLRLGDPQVLNLPAACMYAGALLQRKT
jgi:hypothetical protein